MKRSWKGLGEDVGTVVLGVHVKQLDCALGDPVANQVVANVDVLRLGVVHVILRDETGADVVDVGLNREVHGDDLVNQVDEVQALLDSLRQGDVLGFSAGDGHRTVACLETRTKFRREPL